MSEVGFVGHLHCDGLGMCLAMPQLVARLIIGAFMWLLAGGLFYTVGGVIYAMKFPVFHNRFQYLAAMNCFMFCHGRKFVPLYCDVRLFVQLKGG